MKLHKQSINDIEFYHREGFSDFKTFEEVIGKNTYQKRGMKIEKNEKWIDAGGNVGAFTLLAAKQGAIVTDYEPDPHNCKMIEKNLKLNNLEAEIKQAALVHDDTKHVNMFIGNNNNVWRNSIIKNWNGKGLKVPALNFETEANDIDCCKMDIEGAEMLILENLKHKFKKLVYEWSFDIDNSLERIWKVIDKQKQDYRVEAAWNTICYNDKREYYWQQSWFPPCTNVFLFEK